MASNDQSLYILVSGANRGIGFDLVKALLQRYPRAFIFAGTRDPSAPGPLADVASENSNVEVVKLVADDEESNIQVAEEIKKVTDRLDIVVANAGINSPFVPFHTEETKFFKTNFEVNTLGPLYLYQATYPLLIESRTHNASLPPPKFFVTSSMVGSIGGVPAQYLNGSYGASKAAVNYLASGIHHQTEAVGAVVIPYHPGLVVTDMARKTAKEMGFEAEQIPGAISSEQCSAEYADLIVKATRAEHSGKFWGHGVPGPIPW